MNRNSESGESCVVNVLVKALQAILIAYDTGSFRALDEAITSARRVTPRIISPERAFKPDEVGMSRCSRRSVRLEQVVDPQKFY